jgi:hypothetical protein
VLHHQNTNVAWKKENLVERWKPNNLLAIVGRD